MPVPFGVNNFTVYLNICIRDPEVEIGDKELASGFHTTSSTATSAVEAAKTIVKHVVLPLIGKLFRLQQMRENAPADFRVPCLCQSQSPHGWVLGQAGAPLPPGRSDPPPPKGSQMFPAHPITTGK